jgi:hypothetical protein
MAKPDKNKVQRLSKFDFSAEGSHVALVGKAANGKEEFLITKSLDSAEVVKNYNYVDLVIGAGSLPELQVALEEMLDGSEEEVEANPTMVNMPLASLLRMVGYMSEDEAQKISESVVKSATTLAAIEDDSKREEFTKALTALVIPNGTPGAVDNNPQIKEEDSMSGTEKKVEAPVEEVQTEVAELQKSVESKDAEILALKAEVEKSVGLEGKVEELTAERDERILKAFNSKASDLTVLAESEEGLEGLGKILKDVAGLEGGDKILAMLDKGVELISKETVAALSEVGVSGESVEGNDYNKLELLAKELMSEDSSLTEPQAIVKAASQNPELARSR